MGFDEDIDQLKRELQTPKLDAAGRKQATINLSQKLSEMIQSRRLEFVSETSAEPSISIRYKPTGDKLASVFVDDDGGVTFQAQAEEDAGEDDDFEDAGYFPPYVQYYDEAEFLEEAPNLLKQGIAEYELDQEEGQA
jgi:hypothetical protein